MLTRKQLDLLKYIHAAVQKDGVSPSFDEMKEALDLRSKSGIHRLITALEERGFIRRLAHRARAIEILKLPDGFAGAPAATSAEIIKPTFGVRADPVQTLPALEAQAIPIYGKIAAGVPIEAIQHDGAYVAAPAAMLSAAGEHYALEVKGDSMIDAGIFEGDIVVVQRQDTARNGDIVVALVKDHEATLKKLRKAGPEIELIAANPSYETQRYSAHDVRIQGKMVGLIRSYA